MSGSRQRAERHGTSWCDLEPLLARHPLFAKKAVEEHHSFTHAEIRKHAGWLDFEVLSDNADVKWTEQIIEEFADRWDWETLSYTVFFVADVQLSDDFVSKFEDRWDEWVMDARDGTLPEEEVDGETVPDECDRLAEVEAKSKPPTPAQLEAFQGLAEGQWSEAKVNDNVEKVDFHLLSGNQNVEWSERLLLRYEDKWKWDALASNLAVWETVLSPHASKILDWLSGVDLHGVASLEVDRAGFELRPEMRKEVDRLKAVFGPQTRVIGVKEGTNVDELVNGSKP